MKDRFYESDNADGRREAPAAARNMEPIAAVLAEWLPNTGLVLEIASGTGQHAAEYAQRFPLLEWQPSDIDESALASIAAWRGKIGRPNLLPPLCLDVGKSDWGIARADAIFCSNMVHISPWSSALGLLDGAARILAPQGSLILYGPWLREAVETAPSNLAFDADLKRRNPAWGLRSVEQFSAEAGKRGLALVECEEMPANNVMLLFTPKGREK